MENIQINGQKIWGPPKDWTGPPPPHGTEIYIKNLPDDVFEFELFQIFSTVGRIYEVRLPVHWSGINRGYAFVRYAKIHDADAAIKAFDGFEIRSNGRKIKIERSVDNKRLFLSCVPNFKTAEDIKADLEEIVENVERVYVYPTLENPSFYRGYAFVEFRSHRDAAIAKRTLTPDVCFDLFETKCIAAWANPLPFLDENVLKTINILFMRNIPMKIKGITIKRAIENLLQDNTLQKVKRVNNFAFLTFKNHESARAALNVITCRPDFLGGEDIQIEWAVPRELTEANGSDSQGRFSYDNSSAQKSIRELFRRDFDLMEDVQNTGRMQYDCSNMTDFQKRSKSKKQFISGFENEFPVNFKDFHGECNPLGGHLQPLIFTPKGRDEREAPLKKDSAENSGPKSFAFPNAVLNLPQPEPTWNPSPNSEFESYELFPNPPSKHQIGKLSSSSPHSSSSPPPSPSLIFPFDESPVDWNEEDKFQSSGVCRTSSWIQDHAQYASPKIFDGKQTEKFLSLSAQSYLNAAFESS